MTIRLLAAVFLASLMAVRADVPSERSVAAGIGKFQTAFQSWDAGGFDDAARSFGRAAARDPHSAIARYWQGVALFHRNLVLRNPHAGKSDEAAAAAAAELAMQSFQAALAIDPAHAESHALVATLYGMKVNSGFLGALRFGPKIQKHLKQALAHGPENPRVVYLHGVGLLHHASDEASRRKALETLLAAERHFAREAASPPPAPQPRWGRSSCLTFIGRAHESLGEPDKALASYRRALAAHPADSVAAAAITRLSSR